MSIRIGVDRLRVKRSPDAGQSHECRTLSAAALHQAICVSAEP